LEPEKISASSRNGNFLGGKSAWQSEARKGRVDTKGGEKEKTCKSKRRGVKSGYKQSKEFSLNHCGEKDSKTLNFKKKAGATGS